MDTRTTIGSLLGQSARLIGNRLTANFAKAGFTVTSEQWIALVNLSQRDGITQQDLATQGYKNKASITNLVDNLEKANLVRREALENDRRVNLLVLTDLGRQTFEDLSKIAMRTIDEFMTGIDPADAAICRRVLLQIIGNLT